MDEHNRDGPHIDRTALGGWWTVVLAALVMAGVGAFLLGIILALRLMLYLLGGVGPT